MGRYRIPSGGLEWDGGQLGDLFYIGASADGRPIFIRLPIPADWAERAAEDTPYLLGIVGGFPAWVLTDAAAVDSPMQVESEPAGSIGSLLDSVGTPLYGVLE